MTYCSVHPITCQNHKNTIKCFDTSSIHNQLNEILSHVSQEKYIFTVRFLTGKLNNKRTQCYEKTVKGIVLSQ